ncbi:MAG: FGGY family carbohydrate kinase [Spirochaetales bacterium]|uniref:FGGY family carbohydrate kinase n=1 Tax=Candidatus Thalassospirochaeta sargassi TaxID=3119039 RepID=A0AAJ1IEI8_9SPIO|nr:FGGY family carbohydrate kinase [Spirochaetales bacterium]
MGTYLAGIDIGTTGSKGMVFDINGNVLGTAYYEYPCTYPKPGWVEQDPDLLVESAMQAMNDAIGKSGIAASEIRSVSLSAQRCCAIFLDENENLLRPMISWQDNRTPEEVDEIAAAIDPAEYYKKTGYPNSTTWLLSKMMWVRKNEPETWGKTARIVQMHDYFLRALGVDDYYVDHNDAGYFGVYNNVDHIWDDELLRMFDIPSEILPIPEKSGTLVGKVTEDAAGRSGLVEGTPISVGAGDQSAGSVGAGIVRKGMLSISMGTAGAVTAYLDTPFRDPNCANIATAHPINGCWLMEGYQAAAAGVYRWFRDELGAAEVLEAEKAGKDFFVLMNEKVEKVPAGANGLLMMPYFASAGTPRYNPSARGAIIGLTFAHTRYDMARAFMEGITMDMRDMLNAMSESGVAVKQGRILGGPTKSDIWNQIQADIYGIPVDTLKVGDATVLGAAILGGVGAGIFSSIEEGADSMVALDKRYEPDMQIHEVYNKLYDIYCRAYDGLDEKEVYTMISEMQA